MRFFGILVAVFLLFGCSDSKKEVNLQNGECDLNLQNCVVKFGEKSVEISLEPKPLRSMVPLSLRINGLDGEYKNLKAHIYGLNMDMGTIKADLAKKGDIYTGNIVVSSCVTTMKYRLELFDGEKSLGISVDFVLEN